MLDGLDRRLVGHQTGLQLLAAAEVRDVSGNLEPGQIRPLEPDAGVSGGWLQREGYLVAGMKTNPGASNCAAKRALCRHQRHPSRPTP